LTAFGGPPVHFQILHRRFVDAPGNKPWIDEQTYQELFSVCQALPGPASTKLLFNIAFLHAGFLPALLVFLLWSLPGAAGMYALARGVAHIDPILPGPAYALLSGLNASTVGIIALAAVQLARKATTDGLSTLLLLVSACAGLCYSALWYYPLIMALAGCITVGWDQWLRGKVGRATARVRRLWLGGGRDEEAQVTDRASEARSYGATIEERRQDVEEMIRATPEEPTDSHHRIPLKVGVSVIVLFLATFIALMVTRSVIDTQPLSFRLFTNMVLAGTIIFGGGPVVIPLLRSYVVDPGWVSPRDFLLGLAVIQAFPGPNFNFAVYLGALVLQPQHASTLGALLAFLGIFTPGLTLALGFQSIWRVLRANRFVASLLRGVNAAAVGLVFTAVHRLWQVGYLKREASEGVPLGGEPWWVVVAACAYIGVDAFGVPTAVGIVGGGVLGLMWYAVVKA
jgi:chromate transport protein ChrA